MKFYSIPWHRRRRRRNSTVVQKLWNTVAANLQDGQGDSKVLFLSGALGGLSVFAAADA